MAFRRFTTRQFSHVTKSCMNCENYLSSTHKCKFYKVSPHTTNDPVYEDASVARQDLNKCGYDGINYKHKIDIVDKILFGSIITVSYTTIGVICITPMILFILL